MLKQARVAFVAGLLAAAAFPLTIQLTAMAQSGGSGGGGSGGGATGGGGSTGGASQSGPSTQGGTGTQSGGTGTQQGGSGTGTQQSGTGTLQGNTNTGSGSQQSGSGSSNTGGAGTNTQGGQGTVQGGAGSTLGGAATTGGAGTNRMPHGASGTAVNARPMPSRAPRDMRALTVSDYVTMAALGDMFEVESSRLALEKSQNPNIQAFARKMVDGHTQAAEKLNNTLSANNSNARPPAQLDSDHEAKLAQLRTTSGAAFDRMYLDMQVKGHEQALMVHRSYAANGDHSALKGVAQTMVPIVQGHLTEVRTLAGNNTQMRRKQPQS